MLAPIKKNAKVRLAKADRAHNKFTLPLAVFCFFFSPYAPNGFSPPTFIFLKIKAAC
jgi:hypothetical protein